MVPKHGPQDLTIDIVEGKKPLWGLIHNFFVKELETLRDYLDKNLTRD